MVIDALCVVHGPGQIGMTMKDGILSIFIGEHLWDTPQDGVIYTIEEGYRKLYLGDPDTVRAMTAEMDVQPEEVVEA